MRTTLVWRRAMRLPTVIEAAERTQIIGCVHVVAPEEADEHELHEGHEAGGLRRGGQEGGDRCRRALVGVGRPGVEGHGRDLEGEPDDHEHDGHAHDRHRVVHGVDLVADLHEHGGAGEPVDQRHAVEHDRRGEDTHQVVLETGLVAAQVALAPGGEHVGRDRQQLEGDEDRDQVAGRGHDHHAEHRRQQEDVVLALPVVALGDVVRRQQHDQVAGDDEHRRRAPGRSGRRRRRHRTSSARRPSPPA